MSNYTNIDKVLNMNKTELISFLNSVGCPPFYCNCPDNVYSEKDSMSLCDKCWEYWANYPAI